MTAPLVAIVVPVYNGALHLEECLQSILDQTYVNWRAVVVNNCSSDKTDEIADEFSRRDPRLHVVHCDEFVSKSENYNRSVAQAPGDAKYIKILEADNWITPDCIERAVRLAEKHAKIGIVGSYWFFGRDVSSPSLNYRTQVISGREVVRLLFLESVYLFGTPTTLLFRSNALREEAIWFRPEVFYDDTDLCLRLLRRWDFGFVHQVLAFVREDETGAFSKFRHWDFAEAYMHFLLDVYGEDYFEGRELLDVRRKCERLYLNRLGLAAVTGRKKEYWDFHRDLYKVAGRRFRIGDLIIPIARAVLDLGLNPKSSVEKLLRRWHRRRRPPSAPKYTKCLK